MAGTSQARDGRGTCKWDGPLGLLGWLHQWVPTTLEYREAAGDRCRYAHQMQRGRRAVPRSRRRRRPLAVLAAALPANWDSWDSRAASAPMPGAWNPA